MTAEIVNFNGITTLDIPCDRVLETAMGKMEDVVVIGYDKNGDEYFASSKANGPEVLWMLERAKTRLLQITEEDNVL